MVMGKIGSYVTGMFEGFLCGVVEAFALLGLLDS
jgi:hypothetical protein